MWWCENVEMSGVQVFWCSGVLVFKFNSKISFAELPSVGSKIQGFKDYFGGWAEPKPSDFQELVSLSFLRSVQKFKDIVGSD